MSEGERTGKPPSAGQPKADSAQPTPFVAPRPTGLFGASRMDAVYAQRREVAESLDRRIRAMRKAGGQAAAATPIPKTSGSPLPETVRSRMAPKLGSDLSDVRIHTAGQSAEAAGQLGARAFTVGTDVHFNAGEFSPGTKEGDRLIAHELTHVVQGQKSGIQRKADHGGAEEAGTEVSHPGEPAEKEADAIGDHVADQLHGGAKAGGTKHGDEPGKANGGIAAGSADGGAREQVSAQPSATLPAEKAPVIGAKLDGAGSKIHLARPARDPATPRPDERAIAGNVTTQEGVDIQIRPGALDHILKGHTVENFDPVARLAEIGPGTTTSLFPPGFATNAQEIVTVVKQALGNKAARNFDPAARQLEVTLKKVKLQVWVGPAGKNAPGVYMLNSAFPTSGVSLNYADVQKYANDMKTKKKTLQQVRTELLGRFQ
jgi:hypothetical protein